MQIIYGKIGESDQQVGGGVPGDDWVVMNAQRPNVSMIAQPDGRWAMPTPTAEEQRAARDARIKAVMWRIERHESEVRQGLAPTEPIAPLDAYVQVERDLTNQPGWPSDIALPTPPPLP